MSNKGKIIIGLLSVVLVVLVAAFFFLRYQITKSFPEVSGIIAVEGLHARVEVLRDEFGVPRILASDEHDVLIASGYIHAQDRLWEMDMARRVAEGRLSEIIGTPTLEFDKMFRVIGIRQIANEVEKAMTVPSHDRLTWFAEGVNAFIVDHKGKLPIEFDLLGYQPEPWSPLNSIEIGRLMAWELNLSWWSDLTLGAIGEKVGMEKAMAIFPTYPDSIAPTVPKRVWNTYADLSLGYMQTARTFMRFMGSEALLGGSNAWAVGPAKSASGKPILANDTHLRLQNPSKWYEIQLTTPGYECSGFSIPGVPGIVLGRNADIAWGLTNLMADDADFYIEQIDSTDSSQYLYDGKWRALSFRSEEIRIKGDSAVTFTVRSTHHGPIVTDIGTPVKHARIPYVASMRWTGYEISDQMDAFNKIDRAKNWEEFTAGVKEFSGPGQNFVYADKEGNIGYWAGVWLPIRGVANSTLPLDGWDKSTEWKGFVPFEKLPHVFNPPQGYIATANNKLVDDAYPYHVSDLWEPPSRILRLQDVLGKQEVFSVEDFQNLQNDTYSYQAKDLTPFIIAALMDSLKSIPQGGMVLEYLRNWNFMFNKDDIATSIFQAFFVRFLNNIYKDEMGEDLFHDWVLLVNIPIRVTSRLIANADSPWFDDVTTEQVEHRDDIIRKSLAEGLDLLRDHFGNEMKAWRWGELHTVTLEHPFGKQRPLDKIFNIGPFPYAGGSTALMSGEYSYNEPFGVTVGPSMRQIVDLAEPDETIRVLTSGQSGQVFNDHYSDQTALWLNGTYRTFVSHPKNPDSMNLLIIEPRNEH